ncbi:hypothetical protein [Nonomuraea sp. 3N208]|uniref:hypothetical protein n=1 Tax=Nonomuraea sp. 3N208 TaxID=3457421 RepID=UPI003FCE6DB5
MKPAARLGHVRRDGFDIVVRGNVAKFGQNAGLGAFLLGTSNRVLVEARDVLQDGKRR